MQPDIVYVARRSDALTSDGEVYVFQTQDQADKFIRTSADDWLVTEEPILDDYYVLLAEAADAT